MSSFQSCLWTFVTVAAFCLSATQFHGLESPIRDGRIYTVSAFQNNSGSVNLKFDDAFKISNPDITKLENGTCALSYCARESDFDDILLP